MFSWTGHGNVFVVEEPNDKKILKNEIFAGEDTNFIYPLHSKKMEHDEKEESEYNEISSFKNHNVSGYEDDKFDEKISAFEAFKALSEDYIEMGKTNLKRGFLPDNLFFLFFFAKDSNFCEK